MQVTELMPVSKFVNLEVKFQLMLMVLVPSWVGPPSSPTMRREDVVWADIPSS